MSLLRRSLEGTSYLIALQLCTKVLTFTLNQLVLRYTSPAILGLATVQLELLLNTALFVCREGFRLAVQRMPALDDDDVTDAAAGLRERRRREIVYLSIIPAAAGSLVTPAIAYFYLRSASAASTATPHFRPVVALYTLAALVELASEPCYNLALQGLQFRRRALCEGVAVLARCACTFVLARTLGTAGGALPFACGQLAYAVVLNAAYLCCTSLPELSASASEGTDERPKLDREALRFAASQTAQGLLKYVLTEADRFAVSIFNTNEEQGVYGLAANYGGLLARIVLQPIEEASRSFFGNALRRSTDVSGKAGARDAGQIKVAYTVLALVFRLYFVAGAIAVGPLADGVSAIVPYMLGGTRWVAATPVLAAYCRYLPILALNGVAEAFVAATATPKDLSRQAGLWTACSVGFVGAAYYLRHLGAAGLVYANSVNLGLRFLWSIDFARRAEERDLGKQPTGLLFDSVPIAAVLFTTARMSGFTVGGIADPVTDATSLRHRATTVVAVAGSMLLVLVTADFLWVRSKLRLLRAGGVEGDAKRCS